MAPSVDQAARLQRATYRPLWLSILAGFSFLLGIVTAIPQFYYQNREPNAPVFQPGDEGSPSARVA